MEPPASPPTPPALALKNGGTLLVVILSAAGILRLWNLGQIPPGLYCDEVAMGVNAKCLGESGRSLKGDRFPLYVHEATFEFWNSKAIVYQPIYQYGLVPFVRFLGLSPAVVRLPSVLFGLLGIWSAFVLGKTLFDERLALVAAALLAISPWHFQYSRICFEAISATVFLACGVALLWRGLTRPRLLVVGGVLLGIATYTYPPVRLFAPVLGLGFAWIHRQALWANRRSAGVALAAVVAVVLPNVYVILTDPNQGRMYHLFIFSADIASQPPVRALDAAAADSGLAAFILHHRGVLIPYVFLYGYLMHLSPAFLFTSGDPVLRHCLAGMGMCHVFMAPLLAAGLFVLFRSWREKRSQFLLWWFLTWPIPASLTIDAPHGTRAITNFPILELISAVGACALAAATWASWKNLRLPTVASTVICSAVLFALIRMPMDLIRWGRNYFRDYPVYSAAAWDSGVEEAFVGIARLLEAGEEVCISPSVFNCYLDVLFFVDAPCPRWSPEDGTDRGLLPPRYHVASAQSALPKAPSILWLVKAEEQSRHPRAWLVAQIPYPDGSQNLVLLRQRME